MLSIGLEVVLPVFLLIAVGALLGRTVQPELSTLNRTALYAAVPALVFSSLATAELSAARFGVLIGGQLTIVATMALLSYGVSSLFSSNAASQRGFVATSVFSNSANMMLPVTLFGFGEAGLERALVLFVLSSVLLFSFGPLVLAGRGTGQKRVLLSVLKLPVLWAALSGIGLNLLGWTLPTGIMRGATLLGDAAIPLVLLTLGVQMQKAGKLTPTRINWLAAGFKLGLGPVIGYSVGWLVGARGLDLSVLTLLASMPPAINTFMLALEFGGDAEEIARTVTLATFGALFSLTLVVWLLRGG